MIHELLESYCKYKNISMNRVDWKTYVLTKSRLRISTIILDKEEVTIKYETMEEKSTREEFKNYLKEEIEKEKTLRRLKASARPIKHNKYVRMRLIEYGAQYVRNYTERQSRKANENVWVHSYEIRR